MTTGTTNDELLLLVKEVDTIIKQYRDGAKHIKSLCSEPAPKKSSAKSKAKTKAKASA